jgi:hypothetical protein
MRITQCFLTAGSGTVVSHDPEVNWWALSDLPLRGEGLPSGARVGCAISAKVFQIGSAVQGPTMAEKTVANGVIFAGE